MSIFPLRRREAALSALKLPDAAFTTVDAEPIEPAHAAEPADTVPVSPANELVAVLVELDIVEAVRADNPPPQPAAMPVPLSQRHLETLDRLVAHLKADETRLQQQISDARRQLADTRLARHGFERNGAYLRRGITVLARHADAKAPALQIPRSPSPDGSERLEPTHDISDVSAIALMPQPEPHEIH